MLERWNVGTAEDWKVRKLESWNVGTLERWNGKVVYLGFVCLFRYPRPSGFPPFVSLAVVRGRGVPERTKEKDAEMEKTRKYKVPTFQRSNFPTF